MTSDVKMLNGSKSAAELADEMQDRYESDEKKTSMISESLADFLLSEDEEDEIVYAVPGWIAMQYCYILSGKSGMGKSTLIYDLLVAIAAKLDWMNYLETRSVPVLLLDFENPKSFAKKNIQNACKARGVDPKQLEQSVRIIGRKTIFDIAKKNERPAQFNTDWVIPAIEEIQEQSGISDGILIIDTMREAFDTHFEGQPDWEMKSSNIRKIRRMLTEVLDATGWGCIGMHHNTKTTNEPAGSGDWEGAFDCLLNYTSSRNSKTSGRTLELTGRESDPPTPLRVTYTNGSLQAQEKGQNNNTIESGKTETSLNDDDIFWSCCQEVLKIEMPMNKTRLKEEIQKLAKESYKRSLGLNKIGGMIDDRVNNGLQQDNPTGNAKMYSLK